MVSILGKSFKEVVVQMDRVISNHSLNDQKALTAIQETAAAILGKITVLCFTLYANRSLYIYIYIHSS